MEEGKFDIDVRTHRERFIFFIMVCMDIFIVLFLFPFFVLYDMVKKRMDRMES